ncbi:matrixin family metalloprotease (plasmid) [Paraburkholderia sp. PREW-6R]|uniref:matrixin family metalloprotease n=1 Tax=Paraburkholderia sp. PREW-6R TaxID=3141544 RepID=UPI0031F559A3
MSNAISATDPGLAGLAAAMGGTNSSTFQDFLRIVNASPQFVSELSGYLQKHDIEMSSGQLIEQGVKVNGATDKDVGITISSVLPSDPLKSPGYVLAETIAHELGHYLDPNGPVQGSGDALLGEARAEINAYELMFQATTNLSTSGNLASSDPNAPGGQLYLANQAGMPLGNVTLFGDADDSIQQQIAQMLAANPNVVGDIISTCGYKSACEAAVATAMGQIPAYRNYYSGTGSNASPAISIQSGDYLLQTDANNPSQINVINSQTGKTIQTITTDVLPDGSITMGVSDVASGSTWNSVIGANGQLVQTDAMQDTGGVLTDTRDSYDANGDLTGSDDITYTGNGQLSLEQTFDGDGNLVSTTRGASYVNGMLTGENVFNASGNHTDYIVIDPTTGLMTQDRKFDPITGQQYETVVYQNGQETGYADFANGKQLDYVAVDPVTGLVTQDTEFDPATGQTRLIALYQNGVETAYADFVNGQQVNYEVVNPATGQVTEDRELNPATQQLTVIRELDGNGDVTGEAFFNSDGQETDFKVYDTTTGLMTEDRTFDTETGVETAQLNYQDGVLVSQALFNSAGQQDGWQNFDPVTGQLTENEVLDPATGVWTELDFYQNGQLAETQLYNATTDAETAQLNYEDGALVSQALFNSAGQQDGWQNFDPVTGQLTENEVLDPATGVWTELDFYQNGQLAQTRLYNAVTDAETAQRYYQDGALVSQALFNSAGQQDGWQNFDPVTGQLTENEVLDPATGVWTELDFYQNGQLAETQFYNAVTDAETAQRYYQDGALVSQALFNSAGQQDGWQNFDPVTGQLTENEVLDPATGVYTELDFYQNGQLAQTRLYNAVTDAETVQRNYQDGALVSQALFNSAGQQDGWQNFDPVTGQVTENEVLDPATGVWTELDFYQNGQLAETQLYNATTDAETVQRNYQDGALVGQALFNSAGQQDGWQNFDPVTGQLTENEVLNPATGVYTELDFYQNGQLAQTQLYDAVTNVETAQLSYQGGVLQTEATFANVNGQAQQDGYFWFNDQQQVTAQATFSDGQQTGTLFYDTSKGVVTAITTVSDGAMTGEVFFNDDPSNHYVDRIEVVNNDQVTDYVNINAQGKPTSGTPDVIRDPSVFTKVADAASGNVNGLLDTGTDFSTPEVGLPTDTMDGLYGLNGLAGLGDEMDNLGGEIDDFGGIEYAGLAGSQSIIDQTLSAGLAATAQTVGGGSTQGAAAAASGLQEAALAAQLSSMSGGTGASIFEEAGWSGNVITWSAGGSANGFSDGMSGSEAILVEQAFATWAAASGLQFVEVSDPSQADISVGLAHLDTAATGVVGMTSINATAGVLSSAEIRLEAPSETALATDANGQLAYTGTDAEFEQVLLHEIGHALGLASNADANSIMYYELNGANRTLDATDLAGIQSLYGGGAPTAPSSSSTAVNQLIQAMAAYAPESSAGTGASVISEQPQPLLAAAH